MSRELTRKQLKKDEFVEAAFNVEQWVEENWRKLLVWVGVAVGVVIVLIVLAWWMGSRRAQANELFAEALEKYRAGTSAAGQASLDEALPLLERTQDAGGSIGWLGGYYRAAALLREGQPDEAAAILDDLSGDAPSAELEQAALVLRAKARLEAGNTDEAITQLREVAEQGGAFAPQALLTMGNLLREQGRVDEASDAYRTLLDGYPQDAHAPLAQQALQQLSR